MTLALIKNCTKLTLAGGAVYWSVQQGIWGTSEEGSEAMKRLTSVIAPSTSEYTEKVPSTSQINSSAVNNWNTGMKTVFDAASKLPELTKEYSGKASNLVSSLVKGD